MKNVTLSLSKVIERAVRESFEKQITESLDGVIAEANRRMEVHFASARSEAKKLANKLTLELLQKHDMAGISVEFKI